MNEVVSVRNVTKHFQQKTAVKNIHFRNHPKTECEKPDRSG
ncbi:hypothetical protein BSF_33460 [Bacillus subtilis]|nr:hypothetical protein BSF_33460 [Bacillus subtilis]